jgi:uncharacterized protein (TIGR04255 family)
MQLIPKKITPCSIVEAVFEARFETSIPSAAVLGLLYPNLLDKFQNFNELPILQIPEDIRNQNPNLKYQPFYRFSDNANFEILVGSNVVAISNTKNYAGWELFSENIYFILNILLEAKIPSAISRFGLRYMSFFELDIFKVINFELTQNKSPILSEALFINSLLRCDNFLINLQLSNNVILPENQKKGSLVDIDTYVENIELEMFKEEYKPILENAHLQEKKLFFGLLNKDFLDSFSPEY